MGFAEKYMNQTPNTFFTGRDTPPRTYVKEQPKAVQFEKIPLPLTSVATLLKEPIDLGTMNVEVTDIDVGGRDWGSFTSKPSFSFKCEDKLFQKLSSMLETTIHECEKQLQAPVTAKDLYYGHIYKYIKVKGVLPAGVLGTAQVHLKATPWVRAVGNGTYSCGVSLKLA